MNSQLLTREMKTMKILQDRYLIKTIIANLIRDLNKWRKILFHSSIIIKIQKALEGTNW
jgi:hypothetical protein